VDSKSFRSLLGSNKKIYESKPYGRRQNWPVQHRAPRRGSRAGISDGEGAARVRSCQKGTEVWSVAPETKVFDALGLMAEKRVGAVLVLEKDKLVGLFSE
jgi:hypothetical protein